ncbi:hypothetical protein AX660_21335 [Paraglaciecola hydrolytica]|uniref:SnoaL-like domain-containing protein n=1 Tax=Paraglaciecola hydrolytica TaxID=1799789 RepID=A0A148KMH9_9ALTE|nr:hypothetical protein AX660_21335 [Paraglaciecola hydrolytica]
MMYKLKLALLVSMLAFSALATSCESSCQLEQIRAYFAALDKVSRQGSTPTDIDALLALTHDSVNYIHVEYDANFDKTTWRQAFMRNVERGAYQNTRANEVRILNSIAGKNHTAIEYSHGVIQADGSWQASHALLVLFGFTEGKISLVKEYW